MAGTPQTFKSIGDASWFCCGIVSTIERPSIHCSKVTARVTTCGFWSSCQPLCSTRLAQPSLCSQLRLHPLCISEFHWLGRRAPWEDSAGALAAAAANARLPGAIPKAIAKKRAEFEAEQADKARKAALGVRAWLLRWKLRQPAPAGPPLGRPTAACAAAAG